MNEKEFAKFVDEFTDLKDRFMRASIGDNPPELRVIIQLVNLRLANLESTVARPLPEEVIDEIKGRKPQSKRRGTARLRARTVAPFNPPSRMNLTDPTRPPR